MKITLTGSLGNISKPLAEILVKNGHEVTIISSDANKTADIEALGAKAAIGSVSDASFLTEAFKGADALYLMVPPSWTTSNYRKYIADTGKVYLEAVKASGVKRIVNLSSVGAHLDAGTGPVTGLHDVEQLLNTLDGVAVKYLRPGYFYTNFLHNIPLIQNAGILGNNYGADTPFVLVHPRDIAAVAAQELESAFEGKSFRYIASDEATAAEITKALGTVIDKPELPWVKFSDEELAGGLTSSGLSETIAANYVEMGNAIDTGILFENFHKNRPDALGSTKLADFAKEFATVYKA